HGVAASPVGQTVYAAYTSEGGTGRVMRSSDGGSTWTEVTPRTPVSGEFTAPSNLFYVPGSAGRPQEAGLYMTSDQGLWFLPLKSTDRKLTKNEDKTQPFADPYRFSALYVDTVYSQEYKKPGPVIYAARSRSGEAASEAKVFRSTDGGATWNQFGKGLEQRAVNKLILAPRNLAANPNMVETLLAATDDGVWAVPMPPPIKRTER